MHWKLELILYLLLITSALVALQVRNLVAAVAATSAFSFIAALLYCSMGAVDVGFTEAVVGAGVVGVFFVAALGRTTRRSED